MKRVLSHILINTQREVFRNPKFTAPPSVNSIMLNQVDTNIKRSHFGVVENGINVKNCEQHRSPDFKFFTANSAVTCVAVNQHPQTLHLPCQAPVVRSRRTDTHARFQTSVAGLVEMFALRGIFPVLSDP